MAIEFYAEKSDNKMTTVRLQATTVQEAITAALALPEGWGKENPTELADALGLDTFAPTVPYRDKYFTHQDAGGVVCGYIDGKGPAELEQVMQGIHTITLWCRNNDPATLLLVARDPIAPHGLWAATLAPDGLLSIVYDGRGSGRGYMAAITETSTFPEITEAQRATLAHYYLNYSQHTPTPSGPLCKHAFAGCGGPQGISDKYGNGRRIYLSGN